MGDLLKIKVDKGLTVFYLKNGSSQYLANVVVYRPSKFCIDNTDLEDIKTQVNRHLDGLYKNIERIDNVLVLNQQARSCLCAYPGPSRITINDRLEIDLKNSEIVILENVSSVKVDKNHGVYRLYYLQKPLIKLGRKAKPLF